MGWVYAVGFFVILIVLVVKGAGNSGDSQVRRTDTSRLITIGDFIRLKLYLLWTKRKYSNALEKAAGLHGLQCTNRKPGIKSVWKGEYRGRTLEFSYTEDGRTKTRPL